MTRFARAEGSKASNKRFPEEATDWKTMKEELLKKQKDIEIEKKRKEFEEKRLENYNSFLKEKKKPVKTIWSAFADESPRKQVVEVEGKKKKSKISEDNLDAEIDAFCNEVDDPATDKQFEKLKKDVLKSLTKSNEEKCEKKTKIDDWEVEDIGLEKLEKKKSKKRQSGEKTLETSKVKIGNDKLGKKRQLEEETVEVDKSLPEESLDKSANDIKPDKKKRKLDKKNKSNVIQEKNSEKSESELKTPNKFKKNDKKDNKFKQKSHSQSQKNPNFNPKDPKRIPTDYIMIDNNRIELEKFQGFPIKKTDATRLKSLKSDMINKGIPMNEVNRTMKLERRKAEKALTRERKKVCFICRRAGHVLSECPNLDSNKESIVATSGTGICFKCGSTEHTHFECKVVRDDNYKFATCFICKESGHISRQCPDNPKGLYPKGGACRVCGDVTHLKKDCPQFQVQQEKNTLTVPSISSSQPLDSIDDHQPPTKPKPFHQKRKIVKF